MTDDRIETMPVTYFVALPFVGTPDGPAPGPAEQCQSEGAAVRTAQVLSRKPGYVGAVAFKRTGSPSLGEFGDAEVIKSFGDVPGDLSEL